MTKKYEKHGMNKTPLYCLWRGILQRCNNPKSKSFKHYGGRGIKCLWVKFGDFKNDMYESYSEHKKNNKQTTLERIDNEGHYCKENCKWATRKEQAQNTTKTYAGAAKGERNANAKLNWEKVNYIRANYKHNRESLVDLGNKFGVSWRTVANIVQNRRWQALERL